MIREEKLLCLSIKVLEMNRVEADALEVRLWGMQPAAAPAQPATYNLSAEKRTLNDRQFHPTVSQPAMHRTVREKDDGSPAFDRIIEQLEQLDARTCRSAPYAFRGFGIETSLGKV